MSRSLGGFGFDGLLQEVCLRLWQNLPTLYQLIRKDGFKWCQEAEAAFEELKRVMTSPQLLALQDFSIPFIIECDASGTGIGVALQQNGRPIAFSSQALGPKNQTLSTYKRELIAIVCSIKK